MVRVWKKTGLHDQNRIWETDRVGDADTRSKPCKRVSTGDETPTNTDTLLPFTETTCVQKRLNETRLIDNTTLKSQETHSDRPKKAEMMSSCLVLANMAASCTKGGAILQKAQFIRIHPGITLALLHIIIIDVSIQSSPMLCFNRPRTQKLYLFKKNKKKLQYRHLIQPNTNTYMPCLCCHANEQLKIWMCFMTPIKTMQTVFWENIKRRRNNSTFL